MALKLTHPATKGIQAPVATPDMEARVSKAAADIRAEESGLGDISVFGDAVHLGSGGSPAILIGDTAEIPLLMAGGHRVDYRLGWLANDGDLVVVGEPSDAAFEAYQRRILSQPGIEYLHVQAQHLMRRKPVPQI